MKLRARESCKRGMDGTYWAVDFDVQDSPAKHTLRMSAAGYRNLQEHLTAHGCTETMDSVMRAFMAQLAASLNGVEIVCK